MSNELATTTEDYIAKRLKTVQGEMRHNAICNKSPAQWCLIAKHVLEDGMDIEKFNAANGVKHWTYFEVRKQVRGDKDFEEFRNAVAVKSAIAYEMGEELENVVTAKMLTRIDDIDDIDFKEASQALAQIGRNNSAKLDRFQKLTGAATQRVVVEHKTTLDEAAAFALEAIKEAEVVDV